MTESVLEVEWADPILPLVKDSNWKTEVKKQLGYVPDVLIRVSGNFWLREILLNTLLIKVREFPTHLSDIGGLVVSQENACRYCYGITRAQMKLFGYSDKTIQSIEQDMLLAELEPKDRAFIRFCRNLARSNPRPSKAEQDQLLKYGFSPLAVAEMSIYIVKYCLSNRMATFISSPPMYEFERLPNSLLGRLLRPLIARKIRPRGWSGKKPINEYRGPFSNVIRALDGIPAAVIFQKGLEGAFSSRVLSTELKVLMFAVVARSLSCEFCHGATYSMAMDMGFTEREFEDALSTLTSPRLNEQEQMILTWTRETIHYQTGPIQKRMRELAQEVDDDVILLEAIGVAALANSMVRLAVLLE